MKILIGLPEHGTTALPSELSSKPLVRSESAWRPSQHEQEFDRLRRRTIVTKLKERPVSDTKYSLDLSSLDLRDNDA